MVPIDTIKLQPCRVRRMQGKPDSVTKSIPWVTSQRDVESMKFFISLDRGEDEKRAMLINVLSEIPCLRTVFQ